MNPKVYCLKHGIKTADFIEQVRKYAPKYNKAAHCMASSKDYGVMLRPDISACITKKKEKRKLTCRMSFRCTPAIFQRLTSIREAAGYRTIQDFLTDLVLERIKKEDAAHGGATPKNNTDSINEKEVNVNDMVRV